MNKNLHWRPYMNIKIEKLIDNIEKVIIGKREPILQVITALLCNSHVLIEDVPGVGKTQLAASLAYSVHGEFHRIQLTPDIMPSDILGYSIPNSVTGELEYHKGEAFCNFLLADEINRASSKSQSSLLEIMEEHQLSIDGNTYKLPQPFMTLATQNPVETYGTYHLPEAQMDRFLMKISMGYPTVEEELMILEQKQGGIQAKYLSPVLELSDILELQDEVKSVTTHKVLAQYIMQIVDYTRHSEDIRLGISPRGSIGLYKATKAYAYINGRNYVTPEDIKALAVPVLSHRIILSPKGKSTYETTSRLIESILNQIPVPVRV